MLCESPLLRASEWRLKAYALEVEAWKTDHTRVMHCYRIEDLLTAANSNYQQLRRLHAAWEEEARSGLSTLKATDWKCLELQLCEWRDLAREAWSVYTQDADACHACGFEKDPARYLQFNLEDCERLIGELEAAALTPSKPQLARAAAGSSVAAEWYGEEW